MVLLMLVSINGCVLAHILGAYLHLLYRLFEQLLFILTIRNMTLIEKYNLSLYYSYYFTCNHLFCSYRQGNCVPKKNRLYKKIAQPQGTIKLTFWIEQTGDAQLSLRHAECLFQVLQIRLSVHLTHVNQIRPKAHTQVINHVRAGFNRKQESQQLPRNEMHGMQISEN